MADDRIKLELQIDGEEQAAGLAAEATNARTALAELTTVATTAEVATRSNAGAQSAAAGTTAAAAMATKTHTAATTDLAHAAQLEAMALEHEIAMMKFEQEMLAAGAIQIGDYTIKTNAAAAAHGKLGDAAGKGAKANIDWGRSTLLASQGLEDMQYGIAGVLNNIPMLVMSLGGPMGVAAAISVTAVAGYQLYKNWDYLTNIFEEKRPFPKAAGDAIGLKEELEKVKDELKELQKFGSLTISQENRVGELRASERDLDEAIKQREALDKVKKLKSAEQAAVTKAFEEAVTESGGGESLASLKAVTYSGLEDSDKVIGEITQGSIEAYDMLLKGLSEGMGAESTLRKKLEQLRPLIAKPRETNAFEEAAHEANLKLEEAAREDAKQLTKAGAKLEEDFLHDLGEETRKGLSEGIAKRLEDVVAKTRLAGLGGGKELKYLTDAIADEMKRLYPALAAYPAMAVSITKEVARQIQITVDDAVKELMATEGLTKQQAMRRLGQKAAEKGEGKAAALAEDEFKQAAATEARRRAQVEPGAPPATAESIAARAKQMQEQLKDLGVTPEQQAKIGQLMNQPQAARLVPGAMQALGQRGFGEGEAMRALPQFFDILKGGRAGIENAANRMQLGAERAERAAFNRAALLQNAVPARAPAPRRAAPETEAGRRAMEAKFGPMAPAGPRMPWPGGGMRSVAPEGAPAVAMGKAAVGAVGQLNAEVAAHDRILAMLTQQFAAVAHKSQQRTAQNRGQGR